MDRGAWWGYSPRGRKESDMTVQTYVLQGSIGDPGKPGGVHTARDCFLVVSWPRALGACRFTTRGSLVRGPGEASSPWGRRLLFPEAFSGPALQSQPLLTSARCLTAMKAHIPSFRGWGSRGT